MKYLACLLVLAFMLTGTADAKMPYDAVCNLSCGGSGTLIVTVPQIKKGLIITAAHVLYDTTETTATWPNYEENGVSRVAKPIFVSYNQDTAILVVDNPPGEAVYIAGSYHTNDPLYATGFPWFDRDKLCYQKATLQKWGFIAEVDKAPVAGMSGGGVFTKGGAFIGHVKGMNKAYTSGHFVTNDVDSHIMLAFADPGTWVPIKHHLRDKKKFSFAKQKDDDKLRLELYSESDAPDLEPEPEPIETKVPTAK